jgi:solute carrier family 35 protein C2
LELKHFYDDFLLAQDWTLVLVVAMIATGLFMFVYHYTEFHLVGFLMVLTAAIVSGVRWTFSQTVMQRSQMGLENPVDFMYHIQPVMLLTLVPFVGLIEGASHLFF